MAHGFEDQTPNPTVPNAGSALPRTACRRIALQASELPVRRHCLGLDPRVNAERKRFGFLNTRQLPRGRAPCAALIPPFAPLSKYFFFFADPQASSVSSTSTALLLLLLLGMALAPHEPGPGEVRAKEAFHPGRQGRTTPSAPRFGSGFARSHVVVAGRYRYRDDGAWPAGLLSSSSFSR